MYGDNLSFEHKKFNSMDFGSYGLGSTMLLAGNPVMRTNTAINWGLQSLELSMGTQINPQQRTGHIDQISKIEREELIRLAKLNRINLSLHSSHHCPAGGQGNQISENARLNAIREHKKVIDFADQIGRSMKQKHIPVTIHSVEQIPGNPDPQNLVYAVNKETGGLKTFEKKDVTYPKEHLISMGLKPGKDFLETKNRGVYTVLPEGFLKMENRETQESLEHARAMASYHSDLYEQQILGMINTNKEELRSERGRARILEEARRNRMSDLIQSLHNYEVHKKREKRTRADLTNLERKYTDKYGQLKMFDKTDNFAKEKAKKSFIELGMEAYNKPSKPMIVIEQFSPDHALGNPKQTAELVKDVRRGLTNELVKKKGLSRNRARKEANNIIGMNYDIGHANMWKKYGKTDKEILNEIDEIYPIVKYVHISDNFGDHDTHLPTGWGNAPVNEAMKKLKKKGWKGRPMLETWGVPEYGANAFGVSQSLYGLNANLVQGGANWEMAGGTYFETGYSFTTGPILPDINFQTYGAGFSGLPYSTGAQIGGRRPGEQFSGTPMS